MCTLTKSMTHTLENPPTVYPESSFGLYCTRKMVIKACNIVFMYNTITVKITRDGGQGKDEICCHGIINNYTLRNKPYMYTYQKPL